MTGHSITGEQPGNPVSELFGLAGQVAVVTGGSRGIGRAIAAGFAGAGADVVIASRKLGNCQTAAAEISASTGRTAVPVEFHAGHWADCDRLIEVVYGEFGRCDVLVNNAGMSPLYPDLASVTEEYCDKVQGVNLRARSGSGSWRAPGWPRQFTTFLVELPDPGYQIIRDIPTLHEAVQPGLAGESTGGHAEVRSGTCASRTPT